jgi:hypothetical protein
LEVAAPLSPALTPPTLRQAGASSAPAVLSFGFIGTGQLAVKRFTCIYLTKEPMARPWEEICTVSEVEPKKNKQNLRKIKQLLIGLGDEWMCAGLW